MRFHEDIIEGLAEFKRIDDKFTIHSRAIEPLGNILHKIEVVFEFAGKFYSFKTIGTDYGQVILKSRFPDKTIEIDEISNPNLTP